MEYKDLGLEVIKKTIEDYMFNKQGDIKSSFKPFMENTKWVAEDGTPCSSWNIGGCLTTGDGGAELFRQAMKKEIEGIKITHNKL